MGELVDASQFWGEARKFAETQELNKLLKKWVTVDFAELEALSTLFEVTALNAIRFEPDAGINTALIEKYENGMTDIDFGTALGTKNLTLTGQKMSGGGGGILYLLDPNTSMHSPGNVSNLLCCWMGQIEFPIRVQFYCIQFDIEEEAGKLPGKVLEDLGKKIEEFKQHEITGEMTTRVDLFAVIAERLLEEQQQLSDRIGETTEKETDIAATLAGLGTTLTELQGRLILNQTTLLAGASGLVEQARGDFKTKESAKTSLKEREQELKDEGAQLAQERTKALEEVEKKQAEFDGAETNSMAAQGFLVFLNIAKNTVRDNKTELDTKKKEEDKNSALLKLASTALLNSRKDVEKKEKSLRNVEETIQRTKTEKQNTEARIPTEEKRLEETQKLNAQLVEEKEDLDKRVERATRALEKAKTDHINHTGSGGGTGGGAPAGGPPSGGGGGIGGGAPAGGPPSGGGGGADDASGEETGSVEEGGGLPAGTTPVGEGEGGDSGGGGEETESAEEAASAGDDQPAAGGETGSVEEGGGLPVGTTPGGEGEGGGSGGGGEETESAGEAIPGAGETVPAAADTPGGGGLPAGTTPGGEGEGSGSGGGGEENEPAGEAIPGAGETVPAAADTPGGGDTVGAEETEPASVPVEPVPSSEEGDGIDADAPSPQAPQAPPDREKKWQKKFLTDKYNIDLKDVDELKGLLTQARKERDEASSASSGAQKRSFDTRVKNAEIRVDKAAEDLNESREQLQAQGYQIPGDESGGGGLPTPVPPPGEALQTQHPFITKYDADLRYLNSMNAELKKADDLLQDAKRKTDESFTEWGDARKKILQTKFEQQISRVEQAEAALQFSRDRLVAENIPIPDAGEAGPAAADTTGAGDTVSAEETVPAPSPQAPQAPPDKDQELLKDSLTGIYNSVRKDVDEKNGQLTRAKKEQDDASSTISNASRRNLRGAVKKAEVAVQKATEALNESRENLQAQGFPIPGA